MLPPYYGKQITGMLIFRVPSVLSSINGTFHAQPYQCSSKYQFGSQINLPIPINLNDTTHNKATECPSPKRHHPKPYLC